MTSREFNFREWEEMMRSGQANHQGFTQLPPGAPKHYAVAFVQLLSKLVRDYHWTVIECEFDRPQEGCGIYSLITPDATIVVFETSYRQGVEVVDKITKQ